MIQKFERHTDDELVQLYAQGCSEAFDALLERHDAYLHTYLRFTLKDEDTIEDIFQETFIKVMMTLRSGQYTSEGKFRHWLTRIAHNLTMDHFRREKVRARQQPFPNELGVDGIFANLKLSQPSIEDEVVRLDRHQDLIKCLDKLPDEQREVVRLRYWEDLSFKEIAERTGVSINTALGRMRYALINLRKDKAFLA